MNVPTTIPPKKVNTTPIALYPPPLLPSPPPPLRKARLTNTWTHLWVTNFLHFNPPQYESSHHKQDSRITTSKISHFLFQLQIIKSYNFHLTSTCNCKFHKPPHPTIFLIACGRSKESLYILVVLQENLEPILPLLYLDWHQKQKDEILDSPWVPQPWIKPRTSHLLISPLSHLFQPCHFTTLPPFPPSHLTTLSPTTKAL